jgi:hypothetical protein
MDFEQARQDIMTWIQDFVERPNPALNGWPPCPYARRARINNLLDIRRGIDPYADGMALTDMARWDVVVFVYEPQQISGPQFDDMVRNVNTGFLLPRGMLALGDHPDLPESVRGVTMNQGHWAIMFVQDLKKLDAAARDLEQRNYYAGWPEDYLTELFRFRQDPRQ